MVMTTSVALNEVPITATLESASSEGGYNPTKLYRVIKPLWIGADGDAGFRCQLKQGDELWLSDDFHAALAAMDPHAVELAS